MAKVKLTTLLTLVLFYIAPSLAAAQTAPETSPQTSWTCPEGFSGQTLNVYNWTTYIAEDTIANFEALCGVQVTYDTYPSAEDMLSRIRQGNPGYDIVVPSDVVTYPMIAEGLLEPLDKAKIPNFANLNETLLDLPFDPGNQYTVPYQWGTVGIGYNQTNVGAEVTGWSDLFSYGGPVAWLEDVRGMMGTALVMLGLDPIPATPKRSPRPVITLSKTVTTSFISHKTTDKRCCCAARPIWSSSIPATSFRLWTSAAVTTTPM